MSTPLTLGSSDSSSCLGGQKTEVYPSASHEEPSLLQSSGQVHHPETTNIGNSHTEVRYPISPRER